MIDRNELDKLITAFNQAEQGAPGHLESYLLEHAEEISEKLKELDGAMERAAVLEQGIEGVQKIINASTGVDGWHKNGDIAPWHEIFGGFSLEEWIVEYGSETAGKETEDAGDESEGDSTGDESD